MRRAVMVALVLWTPTAAQSQTIRAVTLGVTRIQEVRRIRGGADREGVTEDGRHRFLGYGQFVFYFDSDSIADFARVLPEDMTRGELAGVFGKPLSETRTPDLSIAAVYSDTVRVQFERAGRLVTYIEYGKRTAPVTPTRRMPRPTRLFLETLETGGRTLRVGSLVNGELSAADVMASDSTRLQAWELPGRSGDSVTVDLLSTDFDSYLWILGPAMFPALNDDDGAGGCNARLTFMFPATATFKVVVSTFSPDLGRFTLRVSRLPGSVAAGDCSLN